MHILSLERTCAKKEGKIGIGMKEGGIDGDEKNTCDNSKRIKGIAYVS